MSTRLADRWTYKIYRYIPVRLKHIPACPAQRMVRLIVATAAAAAAAAAGGRTAATVGVHLTATSFLT